MRSARGFQSIVEILNVIIRQNTFVAGLTDEPVEESLNQPQSRIDGRQAQRFTSALILGFAR